MCHSNVLKPLLFYSIAAAVFSKQIRNLDPIRSALISVGCRKQAATCANLLRKLPLRHLKHSSYVVDAVYAA